MKLKFIQIILNTGSPKKGSKVHLHRILSLQFTHTYTYTPKIINGLGSMDVQMMNISGVPCHELVP